MKKISLMTGIIIFVAALGLTLYFFFVPVITQKNGLVFYLKPGTSKSVLAQKLADQGAIPFPKLFDIFILIHYKAQLRTGEYLFKAGSTNYSIGKQLITGIGLYYRTFTIIPGWNFTQLRQALAKVPTLKQFTRGLTDQEIMSYMGAPNVSPEGEFYPDTYYYTRDIQDLIILRRAYDLMQNRLTDAWNHRSQSLPYTTAYQALIVASMIEKEAYLSTERSLIAGVIVNRLNKNMLLQIDPTVIYGMGARYTGKIMKTDLREDTPYNTYIHKGLPPTPIAMPSQASIDAAVSPTQHDYLYFVAKGEGAHEFTTNLADHKKAVNAARTKP